MDEWDSCKHRENAKVIIVTILFLCIPVNPKLLKQYLTCFILVHNYKTSLKCLNLRLCACKHVVLRYFCRRFIAGDQRCCDCDEVLWRKRSLYNKLIFVLLTFKHGYMKENNICFILSNGVVFFFCFMAECKKNGKNQLGTTQLVFLLHKRASDAQNTFVDQKKKYWSFFIFFWGWKKKTIKRKVPYKNSL